MNVTQPLCRRLCGLFLAPLVLVGCAVSTASEDIGAGTGAQTDASASLRILGTATSSFQITATLIPGRDACASAPDPATCFAQDERWMLDGICNDALVDQPVFAQTGTRSRLRLYVRKALGGGFFGLGGDTQGADKYFRAVPSTVVFSPEGGGSLSLSCTVQDKITFFTASRNVVADPRRLDLLDGVTTSETYEVAESMEYQATDAQSSRLVRSVAARPVTITYRFDPLKTVSDPTYVVNTPHPPPYVTDKYSSDPLVACGPRECYPFGWELTSMIRFDRDDLQFAERRADGKIVSVDGVPFDP